MSHASVVMVSRLTTGRELSTGVVEAPFRAAALSSRQTL